jgi:hypothetical protein
MMDCEEAEEILEELSEYTGYILGLIETHRQKADFNSKKYHTEDYYNEMILLNKILNLLRFLLK